MGVEVEESVVLNADKVVGGGRAAAMAVLVEIREMKGW